MLDIFIQAILFNPSSQRSPYYTEYTDKATEVQSFNESWTVSFKSQSSFHGSLNIL